jgi:hypothetical protein
MKQLLKENYGKVDGKARSSCPMLSGLNFMMKDPR